MDLKNYIEQNSAELTAWKEFKGLSVLLKYEDRVAFQRNLERCKKTEWKRHQKAEAFDDKRLVAYLATLVKDWQGLTLGKLAGLIAITVSDDDRDQQIPCTPENTIAMLRHAYDFDNFVMDAVTDLQQFRSEKLGGEIKNSLASPGTGSA